MTSLGLAYMSSHKTQATVMGDVETTAPETPVAPATAADSGSETAEAPVSSEAEPPAADTGTSEEQ
jgi:hypothetical protein